MYNSEINMTESRGLIQVIIDLFHKNKPTEIKSLAQLLIDGK